MTFILILALIAIGVLDKIGGFLSEFKVGVHKTTKMSSMED